MGLVLEHKQPALLHSVHIYVNVDAAGVVLFALLHIVKEALGAQVARPNGGELHQAEALALPSQLAAYVVEASQLGLQLFLHKRIVNRDFRKF